MRDRDAARRRVARAGLAVLGLVLASTALAADSPDAVAAPEARVVTEGAPAVRTAPDATPDATPDAEPGTTPTSLDARPAPLEVGNVEDLDLAQLRAVIAAAAPLDERVDDEVRPLSLEESLQLALTNNLEIQVSEAGLGVADAEIDEAKARFHPTVGARGDADGWRRDRCCGRQDETRARQRALLFVEQEVPTGGTVRVGAGYERERTSENEQVDQQQQYTNTNQLAGLSVEVFQPLLRGGRIFVARSPIIDAEYGADVNQALLSAAMLRVKAQTKAAYYDVVRAERQVEVAERALQRAQELVDASNALYDAGRVSKVDVYSADVRASTAVGRVATSRAELRVQQNELRRVIGLPVGVAVVTTDSSIPFEPIPVDLADWITRALRNRPELLQKRAELRQAELSKRVAANGKLPELGMSGAFQPGFDWASYNWEAGLSFRMPIGNRAPRARYRQAESLRSAAQTELFRQQRDIELEVREFEIRLRENLARIDSLSRAVESARAKREVAAGRFEMGLASNLDIVNANEELIRSESELLAAVAEYAANVAFLEAAVGGAL